MGPLAHPRRPRPSVHHFPRSITSPQHWYRDPVTATDDDGMLSEDDDSPELNCWLDAALKAAAATEGTAPPEDGPKDEILEPVCEDFEDFKDMFASFDPAIFKRIVDTPKRDDGTTVEPKVALPPILDVEPKIEAATQPQPRRSARHAKCDTPIRKSTRPYPDPKNHVTTQKPKRRPTDPEKRVGKGKHNNGVIWHPEKMHYMLDNVPPYTGADGKVQWKGLQKDLFADGRFAGTSIASLRNCHKRIFDSAKILFAKDERGCYNSRCSKIGCGLIKQSHFCLAPEAEDMTSYIKKKQHDESNRIIVEERAKNPDCLLTCAECNDFIVRVKNLDTKWHKYGKDLLA